MQIDRAKFLSLCLSMFPVAAVACGGSNDDGASAAGADLSAGDGTGATGVSDAVTVASKAVQVKTDTCSARGATPSVSIPTNAAAANAINGVLAPLASPCDGGSGEIESAFTVTANAQGLLSILVTTSVTSGAGAEPKTVQTFDFDVASGGKRLKITDVVTGPGSVTLLAGCVDQAGGVSPAAEGLGSDIGVGSPASEGSGSSSSAPGSPSSEGGSSSGRTSAASTDCAFVVAPLSGPSTWVAKKDGLELESGDGSFQPVLVTWNKLLPSGLTDTAVLAYAKSPK